jgi:uncharacterized protein with PIN domain
MRAAAADRDVISILTLQAEEASRKKFKFVIQYRYPARALSVTGQQEYFAAAKEETCQPLYVGEDFQTMDLKGFLETDALYETSCWSI